MGSQCELPCREKVISPIRCIHSHQLDSAGQEEQPKDQPLILIFVPGRECIFLLAISDVMHSKASCCGPERQRINASRKSSRLRFPTRKRPLDISPNSPSAPPIDALGFMIPRAGSPMALVLWHTGMSVRPSHISQISMQRYRVPPFVRGRAQLLHAGLCLSWQTRITSFVGGANGNEWVDGGETQAQKT